MLKLSGVANISNQIKFYLTFQIFHILGRQFGLRISIITSLRCKKLVLNLLWLLLSKKLNGEFDRIPQFEY